VSDERKVTGLEGRVFTGIFLPEMPDDYEEHRTEESDAARDALSRHVYETYLAALRHAFGDETVLDFEEIDAEPIFDTAMVQYDGGKWEWCNDPNTTGIIYGIEAGLMATRHAWLATPTDGAVPTRRSGDEEEE
jgi:hypothetical protein